MEASQTRGYCVAKCATHRAARSDPSLRKERLFGMTSGLGGGSVRYGSEPNARLLRRKVRDASRGSLRSLTAQRTLVRDDKRSYLAAHTALARDDKRT